MHIPRSPAARGRFAAIAVAATICASVISAPAPAPVRAPAPARSPASGPADGPAPPGAVPALDWSSCAQAPGFECATAKAPLDHSRPAGRAVDLAVIRHRATGPAPRLGTLFFNPGGPGGAGTQALPQWYELFPEELRQRFDIASWDPRGVGESTAVRCFATTDEAYEWLERIPFGFPVGESEAEAWVDAYSDLGRLCEQRDAQLLRHVSTTDTARDLDRLRQAVGDEKLSFLGVSYGTFLGATYANLFPDKVRAMVLDSNIDPQVWVDRGPTAEPRLTTFLREDVDLGSAATLRQFLDHCGRAPADRCAFSAGSPEATRKKFERLMLRLQERAQGSWTYARTVTTALSSLYAVDPGWYDLAWALEDLWEWRPPQETPAPKGPLPYPAFEQIEAIRCSESPNPRDPRRYPELAEFSYGRAGDLGRAVAWASEPCATWPATASSPYTGPWNRPTANPVLVVNTTYDPATPYQGALAMTRQLANARLLTVEGYGHSSVVNPSLCVDDHERRYLVDGVLPPEGTTCRQDVRPFSESRPRGGVGTGGGGTAGGAEADEAGHGGR
ncbi:alpha/beta hydrolase [Streptomyces wuyuanensis]|uniref:Alpha/beta hydrolase fold n=1 Tax=Streptomyces wuyuanensis TaxID=1196353 RepID=A0A1G9Z021_9ACTN|nr:alpha/beta hydrolase [Streptomyces wuyuanensis]SDN14674.1 alpha/beta hydrolase fold [Streptomyces wuyuanensis]